MVPPIIALVLSLAVAGLAFMTTLVDKKMSTPAPAAAVSDMDDEGAAEETEVEEAPADEDVDLGE